MAFTIEQIINLSKTGFSVDQIKAFEQAEIRQTPVQQTPVQQAPVQQTPVQQTPVQQTPVQQVPVQQTPVQQTPVQQTPVQQVPVQQVPVQQTPVQQVQPEPMFSDASAKAMLNFINALQANNLAQATGTAPKTENAYEAGLEVLGKGGNK